MRSVDKTLVVEVNFNAEVIACGNLEASEIAVIENVNAEVLCENEFCRCARGCAAEKLGIFFLKLKLDLVVESADNDLVLIFGVFVECFVEYSAGFLAAFAAVFDLNYKEEVGAALSHPR